MECSQPVVMKATTGLQELPNEMKLQMFEHLPQAALHHLASFNKQFNQLAVPLLYGSFHQYGSDISQVSQYLTTIHAVPRLFEYLRDITTHRSPRIPHEQIRSTLRYLEKDN
jgi:hypothetical protein